MIEYNVNYEIHVAEKLYGTEEMGIRLRDFALRNKIIEHIKKAIDAEDVTMAKYEVSSREVFI